MILEIDIPEHHYNNIIALDSVNLGRVPYKGIIMYAINAIKHGKVLEQEPKIVPIAVGKCDEDKIKSRVATELYSVIKQNYIEREVLDKIRTEIAEIPKKYPMTMDYENGLKEALAIIDKAKSLIDGKGSNL